MAMCPPLSYTFVNGTIADANQVNSDQATLRNAIVNNCAGSGANADITSLSAMTTPLSTGQGGTGNNTGQNLVPTGTVLDFASAAPPAGFLLCDGSAVSRTTYAALFAVIATTFGAGDGSTTFNLPDARGRVTAGYDAGDATGRLTLSTGTGVAASAIGNSGGEQAHAQTIPELATHSHAGIGGGLATQNSTGTVDFTAGTTYNATPEPTTGNSGGGNPFNVVQPTIIFAKIIKT